MSLKVARPAVGFLSIVVVLLSSSGCCLAPPACNTGACPSSVVYWDPCCLSQLEQTVTCALLTPFALMQPLFCGAGCGEVYWGSWISDPPDWCDPCDTYGNWAGCGGGCSDGPLTGQAPCASCAARSGAMYHGVALQQGEVITEGPTVAERPARVPTRSALRPTPAPPPTDGASTWPRAARQRATGQRGRGRHPFALWPRRFAQHAAHLGGPYGARQTGYTAR